MSQAYKVGDRGSGKSCIATLSNEMKAVNKQRQSTTGVFRSDKLKYFQRPKYQFLKIQISSKAYYKWKYHSYVQ